MTIQTYPDWMRWIGSNWINPRERSSLMEQEKLANFKNLLTGWLEELLRHADETVLHMRESEFLPDPLDRASFDSERSFQLRIRDRESILMPKRPPTTVTPARRPSSRTAPHIGAGAPCQSL
jgi:hypothetical protein